MITRALDLRALDMGIDAGEEPRAARLAMYRHGPPPFTDGASALTIEGWDMIKTAQRTRFYARGRLVTVAATMVVTDWNDETGPRETTCTFFGRGRTFAEAVEDLGRVGVF